MSFPRPLDLRRRRVPAAASAARCDWSAVASRSGNASSEGIVPAAMASSAGDMGNEIVSGRVCVAAAEDSGWDGGGVCKVQRGGAGLTLRGGGFDIISEGIRPWSRLSGSTGISGRADTGWPWRQISGHAQPLAANWDDELFSTRCCFVASPWLPSIHGWTTIGSPRVDPRDPTVG